MSLPKATMQRSPGRRVAGLRHLAVALAVVAFASGTASAETLDFCESVTNNRPGDVAIALDQISVNVFQDGDEVCFTFANAAGGAASSITDIYFDDDLGLLVPPPRIDADLTSSTGVVFSPGASPGDLPGGNNANPDFVATTSLSVGSDPATQPNGVNPGEQLTICFDLADTASFASVTTALATGQLRIGVRVQGFTSGGSESIINCPVPEPSSIAMVGMSSLLGLGYTWRKRKRAVV